ncbi:MAG: DNA translocase FtsK 4TM domain-containing protein, partial [Burkholderiales bacterium]
MSATDNDFFDPTAPVPEVATPEATRLSRLLREAGWILFLASSAYLALIFATHSATDAGYFFSGTGAAVGNKGGVTGAWLSDLLLGLFGLSAWWWVILAVYGVIRVFGRVETVRLFHRRNIVVALIGFLILLVASSSLEALRLHSIKAVLPNGAGGVVGGLLAGMIETGLGFVGGTVLLLAVCAGSLSVFSGLSWIRLAERVGAGVEWVVVAIKGKFEEKRDRNVGEQAVVQREEKVEEMRRVIEDHPPIRIEPTVVEIPQSERVKKEKQAPLFSDMPDSPLPTIGLLDAPEATIERPSAE